MIVFIVDIKELMGVILVVQIITTHLGVTVKNK